MPSRLTPRITVVLVSLVFSVAFGLQALGGSAAPKAAVGSRPASAVEHPGPRPELSLTAAHSVPALRDPRKPKPKPKPKQAEAACGRRATACGPRGPHTHRDADAGTDLRPDACCAALRPTGPDARSHAEEHARAIGRLRQLWQRRQLGDPVSAATARRASPPEMRLPVLAVASLVVVAALAGLVLGGVYRSDPAPRAKPHPTTLAAAGVRLELPSGWARGRSTTLAGFHRPLWLRDPHAGLRAGVELLPAASPTLLPVGLHASGAPSTVELGHGRQAWRYQVARTDAVPQVVYAAPTTKGIATVGCLGVSGSVAERACKQLAVALTVPGARRLAPEKRAAFLSRLPATVAGLEAARVKGTDALDAATARGPGDRGGRSRSRASRGGGRSGAPQRR